MPKLPQARIGTPLVVKEALVEFSYFPTAKTVRRAGLQAKAYTTDAWSVIHAVVRQIGKNTNRANAVAFAEQAHEFYSAALSNSTARAKPLLLYYAFLNLTKALCLCRGNTAVIGQAQHGLSEAGNAGTSLKAATVEGFPSRPGKVNMFDEFVWAIEGKRLTGATTYRVHDLIGCSLIGHRLWCDATQRGDRFLKLRPIDIMHDAASKTVWLRAGMQSGARSKAGIASAEIAKKGFDQEWRQVACPSSLGSDMLCWEQTQPVKYTGRPSDKVEDLSSLARRTLYRSLTVAEPFRNFYVYVPPKKFKKHHQMASRYVLLYFLGSVTRYHPADFEGYMTSEFGPFLSEFLGSEPSQMLFEMACLFATREVVSVGLA
jgi:hypothetical protein